MRTFFFVLVVLLLLGPLRRPFFRNWRFNVPASAGALVAWVVMSSGMSPSDPRWMPLVGAVLVGLGAGAAGKQWFDEVFGEEK
jgi:hypothetical protein